MATLTTLTIGSRGSDLALWQANYVRDLLHARYPELNIEIEIIQTSGDKILDTPLAILGGKGVFTKEIEDALIERKIHIAVHSLKDLPTINSEELVIGAVPERANVEDVFLSRDTNSQLMGLPDGATIATGSLRRKAQILSKRPDLHIVDIRGNVPTRIRKLLESDWDGMILARAGVERLGLTQHVAHTISLEWVLPAAGQGALGIQCRRDDSDVLELLAPLNDKRTLAGVSAERALLAAMGGGCQVPIGAYGKVIGEDLDLSACVASLDGKSVIRGVHRGRANDAERIGSQLARVLLQDGGQEILDAVFRLQSAEANVNPHPES
jgi:hydroxymethylbilane synthase